MIRKPNLKKLDCPKSFHRLFFKLITSMKWYNNTQTISLSHVLAILLKFFYAIPLRHTMSCLVLLHFSPDTIPCSYGIDMCLFLNFIFPFTSMQTFLIRKFSMTNLPSLHLCNTQYNIILTFVKQSKSKMTLIPWGNSDVVIPPSLLFSSLFSSSLFFLYSSALLLALYTH